jgi:hypothetical protein
VIRWQRPLLPFREVMKYLAGFKDTGKRMLAAWSEEVSFLRDSRTYSLSPWKSAAAFEGIFDPPKLKKNANRHRSLGVIGSPYQIQI